MIRSKMEKEKQKILEEMVYPWDRQLGESSGHHRIFLLYLNMGRTRNYKKVANNSQYKYATVLKVAHEKDWENRAKEFDENKDREFAIILEEEVLQSRIRQQRIGSSMQGLGERALELLEQDPESLSAGDVTKLIDIGVKIERLALGTPSEIMESKSEINVEMKVEEIPKEISEKIGRELAIEASKKMEINV